VAAPVRKECRKGKRVGGWTGGAVRQESVEEGQIWGRQRQKEARLAVKSERVLERWGGAEDEGKVRRRRKEVGEGQEGVAGGWGATR